jgi:Tfp pilus assembly protein PilE
VVIIGILVALALPSYVRIKDKAREAEVKASLHNIQLSIERFGVDNEGNYPGYLIGGDNRWMTMYVTHENIVRREYHDSEYSACSDPLLRGGYVDAYPKNPFVSNSQPVQLMQRDYGDPLRSSFPDGQIMGTRFGAESDNMGQVLCDARWLTWNYIDPLKGQAQEMNTWSNVQYDFYDAWLASHPHPYLPGGFMYKSFGEVAPKAKGAPKRSKLDLDPRFNPNRLEKPDDATIPLNLNDYMLSAWGGLRTKGQDLLGEEPLVMFSFKSSRQNYSTRAFVIPGPGGPVIAPPRPPKGPETIELMGVPPWTRGVNRSHVGPLWGSPYGPSAYEDRQLSYGNANGVRDGLIIMLTPGQD